MDGKIGRNDLCQCGSGKKYKNCCGAHEAISITHVIETELDELQKQLLQFAVSRYEIEIQEDFEDLQDMLDLEDDQEIDFYQLIHTIWFTFFEELEDGERIIEKFIASESRKIKRPKLKQIVQTWTDARTIAGKVNAISDNRLTVLDGLTREELEVVIPNHQVDVEVGSFFIGFILPYGEQYVFIPGPLDLPNLPPEQAFEFIEQSRIEADYDSAEEYLTDFFLEIMNELPMAGGLDLEDLDWPGDVYKEVAVIFQKKLESLDESKAVSDMGIVLWFQFCQKRLKKIQNPNLYAAALHYLVSTIVPMEDWYTQKAVADLYGVSASGTATKYREMEQVLSHEISELIGIIEEDDDEIDLFDPRDSMEAEQLIQQLLDELEGEEIEDINEINDFIDRKLKTRTPKKAAKGKLAKAQQLIYEAIDTEGKQRYQLAQEALNLNPNCVDAYVILADQEATLKERAKLYEKGMHAGESELGKAFFEENKGYFWGMIETRPFMRAKSYYAEALYKMGDIKEATQQFEELLDLNPNDNQGVRYELFVAYMDMDQVKKARRLLQQYKEGTVFGLYNKLLLEIHENGFTENAVKLWKNANKENKHVVDFLTGKKRLPKDIPDFYGFGDENEAIVYADMHLHLWKKIDGLKDWLKKQK